MTNIGKAARIQARTDGNPYPGAVVRVKRTGRLLRVAVVKPTDDGALVIAKCDGRLVVERACDVALVA